MPRDPVYLNRLTLAQLHEMSVNMANLVAAGDHLDAAGFAPIFDLTPGLPVSIHLDLLVPADPRVASAAAFRFNATPGWVEAGVIPDDIFHRAAAHLLHPEPAQPEQTRPEARPGGDSGGGAAGSDASPAAPEVPEPLAVRAAYEGTAGDDPDPASPAPIPELPVASGVVLPESARQDAQEQPDGDGCNPSPVGSPLDVPPPEPDHPVTPGSVRALAATNHGPLWTEDEDARAVAIAVELLRERHRTINQLAAVIGPALGRPVPGTAYRLRKKLSLRINAALAKCAVAPAPTKQTFAPPAPPAPAASPPVTKHLQRHVAALPANPQWSRAQDIELLELLAKGFTHAEIAVELKGDFPLIKKRAHELLQFDLVLKRANFSAADVLAALTAKA